MQRTATFTLLLLTGACATTEPTSVDPQPAPMGETAPIDPANGATTQAVRSAPAGLVFTRSDSIAHEWTDAQGRRMHVVFRLSLGMPADRTAAATQRMQGNWATAAQQARRVCEGADLTTDPGTEQCEQRLCEVFTRALAKDAPGNDGTRAARVIWQRLTWD